MAIVWNVTQERLPLTRGYIEPDEQRNVDVTLPAEASFISDGALVVVDGSADPPAPTTKTVPVVTTVAFTDPSRQVNLDIPSEATDAELAAAIAAIGGRFRGAYASLSTGAAVKANDVVTNPSGALVSRIADGTISGSYNSANWTALSAGSGVPAGGTIDQFLGKLSSTDGDAAWINLPISVIESVNAVATAGAAQTLPDVSTATVHALTLTAATCALTFPAAVAGKGFTVVLKQDATGGRLVTWPGSVAWAGGVTPGLSTAPNGVDVFSFLTVDGTTWLGFTRSQASAARPYRAAVLTDTPISYWRLGEASGSAAKDEMAVNNGTYVGDYTLAQAGLLNSEADKAVKFGTAAQGHALVKSGQILSGLTNWTIEAWVNPTSSPANLNIYSERGSAGNDILDFGFSGGSQLFVTYRDHAGTIDQIAGSTSISSGAISHVALTKSGTTIKYYINGALDKTATLTAGNTFGEATAVTWLGCDPQDLTHYYKGVLDEVAVYNTALSGARIAAHYAAGIALP